MISLKLFKSIVIKELKRDIRKSINPNQNKAISTSINHSQFIVAGPGSSKNHNHDPENSQIHLC